jgi:hypothetical protein
MPGLACLGGQEQSTIEAISLAADLGSHAMPEEPIDYDAALRDPAKCFKEPAEVVKALDLTLEQRIEILRRWESDARLLMIASEENMQGGERPRLQAVHDCLRELGVDPHDLSKETGSKLR